MSPIHTILHPTDFSESAEGAFSVATVLAREHHARIIVLHVYSDPAYWAEIDPSRHGQVSEAEMYHLLEKYQAPDPTIRVEHRLVEGEASREILHQAAEEDCDVIVMGTQGRTGLGRLLFGSVAEKVMRGADCPVLAVRLPDSVKAKRLADAVTVYV